MQSIISRDKPVNWWKVYLNKWYDVFLLKHIKKAYSNINIILQKQAPVAPP